MSERLQIEWSKGGVASLSALYEPAEPPAGVRERGACLLAHGAGYHMESPFLGKVARGLVERGFSVLSISWPLMPTCMRSVSSFHGLG